MIRRTILCTLFFLAISSLCRCVAGDTAACPKAIAVQQQLTSAAPGWTALLDDAPHQLAGITFYDGTPQEKASLVYDSIKKSAGKQKASWEFASTGHRQIWIACSYSGTSVQLGQALPAGMKSCEVEYDTRVQVAGSPLIEKVECK